MIRLAEARAKCDSRDKATKEDAEDVVQIMKFSLWDTYQDNMGHIDFQRSQMGEIFFYSFFIYIDMIQAQRLNLGIDRNWHEQKRRAKTIHDVCKPSCSG